MADASPPIQNAVPGSTEVSVYSTPAQPVPLSKQQAPAPTEIRFYPVLPTGWELIDVVRDNPEEAFAVLNVAVGGKPHEWRFNKLTGDGELRPTY